VTTTQAPNPGPTIDRIGECRVLRDVLSAPGIQTVEGRMLPLMAGNKIRTHIIEMAPGQYCHPHPHPTESLIYTLSGRWVFCTTENDEEVRIVINAGDMFHFVPDVPTGFETPFAEGASILIFKGDPGTYEEMYAGIAAARDELAQDAANGAPYTYADLPADHPARVFGASVAGRDPAHLNGATV
jgi:quercetin dioxygenase-like cupin family protein